MNVAEKITIVYRDSKGNEHASYEAACIAQVLLDKPALYIESHKLIAIAEAIANYFYLKRAEQAETNPEEAEFSFEAKENLHG